MKRWLLVLTLPALLAAAPSPLVVGSVRDQYGAPISGATVTGGAVSTQTDAQGTFALASGGVTRVRITCPYCEPLSVAVPADEPVVALVHRYQALAQDAPSETDIGALPYARAESIVSLRPFTVLENSSHALPGAQISDRGSASRGSLLLDDGIPMYDIATNQSPFIAFPAYTIRSARFLPPSDAFRYGDLAGAGTIIAGTHAQSPESSVLAAGDERALRTGQTLAQSAWTAAISHDAEDTRMRADGSLEIPAGDDAFALDAVTAADRLTPSGQYLSSWVSGVRAAYRSERQNRIDASFTADGGGYDGDLPAVAYNAKWSDLQLQGGVTTTARIQFFAGASARTSSGRYWTSSPKLPLTAGIVTQARVDAGVQTSGERYALRLGAGAFDLHYSGGLSGKRGALDGGLITPSFFGSYAFDPHWALEVQAGESFALPTVLEAFVHPQDGPDLTLDRNLLLMQTVRYGDLHRFRAEFTAMTERVSGLDNGTINSVGISASWQVAPAISLRAWLLHENDRTRPYEALYRFGARPQPASVGSYWITYESAGLRIDAIYRRDLLDYRVDPHFDASISAPLWNGARIFGATERRAGTRYVTAGLRFDSF